jgi:hypothetical protein
MGRQVEAFGESYGFSPHRKIKEGKEPMGKRQNNPRIRVAFVGWTVKRKNESSSSR